MDKTAYIMLRCPKCHSPARAKVNRKVYKFLIYICPICNSNVVYYGDIVDVLSDELMQSLLKNKGLQFCGDALFPRVIPSNDKIKEEYITQDRIVNLKILLNTDGDVDVKTFLSKLK